MERIEELMGQIGELKDAADQGLQHKHEATTKEVEIAKLSLTIEHLQQDVEVSDRGPFSKCGLSSNAMALITSDCGE